MSLHTIAWKYNILKDPSEKSECTDIYRGQLSGVSGMMHVMNAQVSTSVDIVLPEYPAYIPMHLHCKNILGCMTSECVLAHSVMSVAY